MNERVGERVCEREKKGVKLGRTNRSLWRPPEPGLSRIHGPHKTRHPLPIGQ